MASGLMPNLQGYKVHGFIPSFSIKVDEFVSGSRLTTVPTLHLLSYTHSVSSDHIIGLSAKSFKSTVICSGDAKKMLPRHKVCNERALKDVDLRGENTAFENVLSSD